MTIDIKSIDTAMTIASTTLLTSYNDTTHHNEIKALCCTIKNEANIESDEFLDYDNNDNFHQYIHNQDDTILIDDNDSHDNNTIYYDDNISVCSCDSNEWEYKKANDENPYSLNMANENENIEKNIDKLTIKFRFGSNVDSTWT